MVPARDVQRLTGLSADQLREWTLRRGLVRPDVAPGGPGRPALYGWQSVLILRLAVVLRERFRIELHAHADLLLALRELLVGVSFPALRGSVLALRGMEDGELLAENAVLGDRDGRDSLILRLAHISVGKKPGCTLAAGLLLALGGADDDAQESTCCSIQSIGRSPVSRALAG